MAYITVSGSQYQPKDEHEVVLRQGREAWNAWRDQNPEVVPNLERVDFHDAMLFEVNLRGANLYQANLSGAKLFRADLDEATLGGACLRGADLREASIVDAHLGEADLRAADLRDADLSGTGLLRADFRNADLRGCFMFLTDLRETDFSEANLSGAKLCQANLTDANLAGVKLSQADLTAALLIRTKLSGADLSSCRVYGVSAWGTDLDGAVQKDLVVTQEDESTIEVDDLQIAQFVYMLLRNSAMRPIIEAITSKVVLILGRFTPERKTVLDALRIALRDRGYLPVLFDWEKPSTRDVTETVSTLAHLSRFVVADLTDAKSIPQELMAIVPNLPSVPVQPILLASQREYGMFEHFRRYPWVLPVALYDAPDQIVVDLERIVILPAEAKVREIRSLT